MRKAGSFAGCATTVRTAPPPPRAEVRPAPPFHGAAWIGGHYTCRCGKYVWIPGTYVKPPQAGAPEPGLFTNARHESRRWVPGHWR